MISTLLRGLCVALAFAVVSGGFCFAQSPEAMRNDGDSSLKILSWNIYMLPHFVFMKSGKRKRARLIAQKMNESDYDIIVFQEAFKRDVRGVMWRRMKDKFPYEVGPANINPFSVKTNSGVWILSRRPIQKIKAIRYKKRYGFDNRMARKGALMVSTEWKGKTFQIIGTHLNAGGKTEDIHYSQLQQIQDQLLKPYKKDGVPQIVCGDMNLNKSNPEHYQKMLEILNCEDCTVLEGCPYSADGVNNDLCGGGEGNRKVIDFVLHQWNGVKNLKIKKSIQQIKARWSPKHEDLSDHLSIEAIITEDDNLSR